MNKIAGIVFIAVGLLTILPVPIILFNLRTNKASDISIIGGADGPTSIFIAGRIGYSVYGAIIAGIVSLVIGLVLLFMKRK